MVGIAEYRRFPPRIGRMAILTKENLSFRLISSRNEENSQFSFVRKEREARERGGTRQQHWDKGQHTEQNKGQHTEQKPIARGCAL